MDSYFPVKKFSIIRNVWILNIAILTIFAAGQFDVRLGFGLTVVLLLYLMAICIEMPRSAFFIVIGIKFVFDSLWTVDIPETEGLKATHLFLVPLCLLAFSKVPIHRGSSKLISLFVIYLAWLFVSSTANGIGFNVELFVRHSIPVFGIVFVSKYMRHWQDLDLLIYVIAIGTLIPLSAILVQYVFMLNGVEILFSKYDAFRGVRISGLYYDAGTSGSIALIALISSSYMILKKNFLLPGATSIAYIAGFLSVSAALLGETRAIVAIAVVIIVLLILVGSFVLAKPKKILLFVLVLMPALMLFENNIDSMMKKTALDSDFSGISLGEVMSDSRTRTLLTGRVGLWQDIWHDYEKSSLTQKMFGSGKSTNAHSTYFYLLFKIGMLGLIFYLMIHVLMVVNILRNSTLAKPIRMAGTVIVFTILALGISLNVTLYTTYQIVLYLLAGSIMLMRGSDTSAQPQWRSHREATGAYLKPID
jgi:hypothetical protein